MIKVTAVTEGFKSVMLLEDEEAESLWVKARSQMNNNHMVTFGNMLLNPKYLQGISFEEVNDREG